MSGKDSSSSTIRRDETETAVPQALAASRTSRGAAGSRRRTSSLNGMLESTRSTSTRTRVAVGAHDHALDVAVLVPDGDVPVIEQEWHPCLLDALVEALPHLAGPEARVPELLDQSRHMRGGADEGLKGSLFRVRFLIRCAAH